MDDFAVMTELLGVFADLGSWVVFLYLFMRETNKHEETRKAHIKDLRKIAKINEEPLRDDDEN